MLTVFQFTIYFCFIDTISYLDTSISARNSYFHIHFSPYVCRFWVGPTKCFEHISHQIEFCDGDRASICIWSGFNVTSIDLNSNYSPLMYCWFVHSFNLIFNGFHNFFLPLGKLGDCIKRGLFLYCFGKNLSNLLRANKYI